MVSVSVPFILLAIAFITVGRLQIRRARRLPSRHVLLNWWGWMLCIAGVLLMTLGVLLW
jgi:hypothetical protein